MRIPISDYTKAFQLIQEDSRLAALFKTSAIKNTVVPVSGVDDLVAAYKTMIKPEQERRVCILLNCGGSLDLFEEFELNLNPQLTLYVMDSHRPYHPSNYSNARQVFLFDDSDEPIENPTGPPPDQLDYGLPPIYNVTGDADMDDVYDADDIDERPPEEPIEDEEEEEEGEDDDEDDEEAAINKRRRRLASFRENLAIPHAFTSAGLMYALASKLERETNELLWYAIVGLTDQFIHQRIDRMRYLGDMQHFREEVLRTNIQDDETAPVGSSHTTDANRIVFIPEDYNFMLYRHWTLYESLSHSRHIAVKLKLWTEVGIRQMETWLAQLGIPLAQCREKWSNMRPDFKKGLAESLTKRTGDFVLGDLFIPAFVKKPHFNTEVCAADVAYATSALLESRRKRKGISSDVGAITAGDQLKENFWVAYQAVQNSGANLMQEGFDEAIELQKATFRQLKEMIDRREIGKAGKIKYARLRDTPDARFFSHPLALSKLAHFIVDILLERKQAQSKPLLLAAPRMHERPKPGEKEQFSSYLVVGVASDHSGSARVDIDFGQKFAEAATKIPGVEMEYTSFDSAIVSVPRHDLDAFQEFVRTGVVTVVSRR